MNYDMEKLWKDSHTSAGHSSYLEGLYESYLENPASVSLEWKDFFINSLTIMEATKISLIKISLMHTKTTEEFYQTIHQKMKQMKSKLK